jgi:hypothetical protein
MFVVTNVIHQALVGQQSVGRAEVCGVAGVAGARKCILSKDARIAHCHPMAIVATRAISAVDDSLLLRKVCFLIQFRVAVDRIRRLRVYFALISIW